MRGSIQRVFKASPQKPFKEKGTKGQKEEIAHSTCTSSKEAKKDKEAKRRREPRSPKPRREGGRERKSRWA